MIALNILGSSSRNGAKNVVIETIQEIKRKRHAYKVKYVSLDGPIRADLVEENIAFVPIKKPSVGVIKRLVKRYKLDIIHAHGYSASVICAMSMVSVPDSSHLHGNPPWIQRPNVRTILNYYCFLRFRASIGVSE